MPRLNMPKTNPTKNKPKEPQDFESVAKYLECDDDKEALEKNLGKIAKSRPPERLPERSEAVSGKESEGITPIAAAQSKETQKKIAKDAKVAPSPKPRR
jgi:hypothetical protein